MTIQGLKLYEIDLYIFGLSLRRLFVFKQISPFVCFQTNKSVCLFSLKKRQNQSSQNILMDPSEVFRKGTNGKCSHVKKTLKSPKEGSESS